MRMYQIKTILSLNGVTSDVNHIQASAGHAALAAEHTAPLQSGTVRSACSITYCLRSLRPAALGTAPTAAPDLKCGNACPNVQRVGKQGRKPAGASSPGQAHHLPELWLRWKLTVHDIGSAAWGNTLKFGRYLHTRRKANAGMPAKQ